MTLHPPFPRVLTIAGSDSGGGAGIQADLKTFAALGAYGASAITAITAQNTCGVRAVQALPPEMITAQCDAVLDDMRIDAVKIGMLADVAAIEAVAAVLRRRRLLFVVLDPVMVATSGDGLALENTVAAMCAQLLPLADVVTPNLSELAALSGQAPALDENEMLAQGQILLNKGAAAVLLKGGHWADSDEAADWLLSPDAPRLHNASAARASTATTPTAPAALCRLPLPLCARAIPIWPLRWPQPKNMYTARLPQAKIGNWAAATGLWRIFGVFTVIKRCAPAKRFHHDGRSHSGCLKPQLRKSNHAKLA